MNEFNKGYIKGYKDAQLEFEKYYSEAVEALQRFTKLIPKKGKMKENKLFTSDNYKNFIEFISEKCPNVNRVFINKPSEAEFEKLKIKAGSGTELMNIILDLDNYSKINKYKNLTRTLNNWLDRRAK